MDHHQVRHAVAVEPLPRFPQQPGTTAGRIRKDVLPFLPRVASEALLGQPDEFLGALEEVRLRVAGPPQVIVGGKDLWVTPGGRLSPFAPEVGAPGWGVQPAELARCLALITASSLFAVEEELRQGFLTLPGGHRVGVAGKAVLDPGGVVRTLKDVSYLNVRIAREALGAAGTVAGRILEQRTGLVFSTIILSPPGAGKTTLLRDLARLVSRGVADMGLRAARVAVVDERMELAGSWRGLPQFDLGPRTDVLSGCPKADGLRMLLRAMSPEVAVTDELGSREDADAITDAGRAGVRVLASAHATDVDDLRGRPLLARILDTGVFRRAVTISRRHGPGTIEGVIDLATGKEA